MVGEATAGVTPSAEIEAEAPAAAADEWRRLLDEASGAYYWWNDQTGESQWHAPQSGLQQLEEAIEQQGQLFHARQGQQQALWRQSRLLQAQQAQQQMEAQQLIQAQLPALSRGLASGAKRQAGAPGPHGL